MSCILENSKRTFSQSPSHLQQSGIPLPTCYYPLTGYRQEEVGLALKDHSIFTVLFRLFRLLRVIAVYTLHFRVDSFT